MSLRVLIVDPQGAGLDFAIRALRDGHKVKLFIRQTEKTKHIGRGFVEIVDDFRPWLRWADLIFNTDNTRYLRELDAAKAEGQLVVSASQESAQWELDRELGMKILRKHGVQCPAYQLFSDYDKAIAYVKKENRRFVSKPSGDADKALSYVAKTPADLCYMLDRWKKTSKLKGAFLLQEFVGGIEMAVGGWFGPGGFNRGWCENWEFKKLMDGDLGVNCFDETTEVLTEEGWKFWPEVTEADRFCTLEDERITFVAPEQLVVADFDGELIGWKSGTVDILVTPNHNMLVQDDHARKPFFFEPAETTAAQKRLVKRTGGDWVGAPTVSAAEACLLGAYVADGHCRDKSVVFGNCPPHKAERFTKIAAAAGYRAKLYGRDLYINSVELVRKFKDLGRAHEKFAPSYIKDSTPDVIEAFLHGLAVGDGSQRPGNLIITTISRRLADDVQELLLKVGQVGTINTRDRRGESHLVNGVECVNRHIAYDISVASRQNANLGPDIAYRQRHIGKIYCVTVPSHIIYVRRNGKPLWIGQTGEQGTVIRYVRRSKLAERVLAPLSQALERIGYVGYIDVNCIIDEKGTPWPLEFTMRPGWPTFNIQQALHEGDSVEWLYELANGRDARNVTLDCPALGVVLSVPDYPYSHLTRKEVVGTPIYGITEGMWPNLHPCEMMMGEAPCDCGGDIITVPMPVTAGDYVLVVSAVGDTVRNAKEKAYRRLKRLTVPNSPMYRTDIGDRLGKQLPKLQALGYATGLKFSEPS